MYYLIISILFGLIPEVLYFTLILIYTKNLKTKRLRLFFSIALVYFICVLMQNFQLLFYMLLILLIYIALKLLYGKQTQITDIFIISLAYLWVALLSVLSLMLLKNDHSNYHHLYILDRILLFTPFIFKNNFNNIYKKYYRLWNRDDSKRKPIKSITLRNISLILLNSFIFLANITIINIINSFK